MSGPGAELSQRSTHETTPATALRPFGLCEGGGREKRENRQKVWGCIVQFIPAIRPWWGEATGCIGMSVRACVCPGNNWNHTSIERNQKLRLVGIVAAGCPPPLAHLQLDGSGCMQDTGSEPTLVIGLTLSRTKHWRQLIVCLAEIHTDVNGRTDLSCNFKRPEEVRL